MNTNPELLPTYKSLSPVLRTQTTSSDDVNVSFIVFDEIVRQNAFYRRKNTGILVDFSEITAIVFDSQQIPAFHVKISQNFHNGTLLHI